MMDLFAQCWTIYNKVCPLILNDCIFPALLHTCSLFIYSILLYTQSLCIFPTPLHSVSVCIYQIPLHSISLHIHYSFTPVSVCIFQTPLHYLYVHIFETPLHSFFLLCILSALLGQILYSPTSTYVDCLHYMHVILIK